MRLRTHAIPTWAALACALIGLSACEKPQAEQSVAPAQVSVITLPPAPRPYIRELPGRIAPTRVAEVRARVAGIVLERSFQQGADVKAGDVLYRIDPVRFEVELKAAEAALAKAQAVLDQGPSCKPSGSRSWPPGRLHRRPSTRPRWRRFVRRQLISPRARRRSRAPSSISTIPASARRSAAVSVARW